MGTFILTFIGKEKKIIEKKLNFNVTTLVIHDKELSDRLLKEAIKEKTTNKTSLICDLLNEALDYRSGDYKDPCVSMLTNVIDNQNKMIEILFEIISKMDKKEIKDDIYHKLLCVIIKKILNLGKHSFEYTDLDIRLQEYDAKISSIAETHNIDEYDYLLRDKFKDDLFRRMGNVIIQELLKRKRFEEVEKKKLKHKKSEQAFHRKMLLEMIGKSFELMNKLEDEEAKIFEEYQYKLKKVEYERLVEEGVIEAEM